MSPEHEISWDSRALEKFYITFLKIVLEFLTKVKLKMEK